jgi:hypothetical protein
MASSPGEGGGATFKVRLPISPSEIGEGDKLNGASTARAKSAATAGAGRVHAL